MYQRALKGSEKVLELEHTSTLHIVNNLRFLYSDQNKLKKIKKMYQRVLKRYEKALKIEYILTFRIVNNLKFLYNN